MKRNVQELTRIIMSVPAGRRINQKVGFVYRVESQDKEKSYKRDFDTTRCTPGK